MLALKQSRSTNVFRSSPVSSKHPTGQNPLHATYASVRNVRQTGGADLDEVQQHNNDFIMSILRAKPSLRDSKSYLASFGANPSQSHKPPKGSQSFAIDPFEVPTTRPSSSGKVTTRLSRRDLQVEPDPATSPVLASILDPVIRRTALVKIQGPFTHRQLSSVAQGMVYLEKLGLVSVVVVENDETDDRTPDELRQDAARDAMDVAAALESQGAKSRPILHPIVRLGPKPGEEYLDDVLEAHTFPSDLISIRSALRAGEIPVLPPLAVDSSSRCTRIDANDVIAALTRGMVEASRNVAPDPKPSRATQPPSEVDLTPLRLMIINKEGGIPSYARAGLPHLLVNLDSEYDYIKNTFRREWWFTNPSALSNLKLAHRCMSYMPPAASAIMVSHRSRSSLIANLITNKPAFSSSLPHALLQGKGEGRLSPDTPTLLRRGLPIRVIKFARDIDKPKMTALLEKSFSRTLNQVSFYTRLEERLDFAIIAGDYAGAAIVTSEPDSSKTSLSYLDKFAVLPEHQGGGTVDFLWVALHDESYGLGLPYSVNPNGGKEGEGEGRDLVWRSRANNPINKWYFERSSGHIRMGDWVLFWCDAEARLKDTLRQRAASTGRSRAKLSFLEEDEVGRMERWSKAVASIPSAWK